jgi:glucokinase
MKEYVIGIDIGGTFTKTGFVDREGNIHLENSTPTDPYDTVEEFLENLVSQLKNAEKRLDKPYQIVGIGIGAPNGNFHKGTIEMASNLKWKGIVPFTDLMKEYYELPIILTNDANAAALGEKVYGGAKNLNNYVMITLGTGLGSGVVVNGNLVYGHDGFAGEIGHVSVEENGRQCGCGNRGCLETYVSAPGIKRTLFELMSKDTQGSKLVNYTFEEMDAEIIYQAAKNGDPLALNAFEFTAKILGRKLADTIVTLSPKAFFFFGGLSKSGDLLFKPTKKWMEHYVMRLFKDKVELYPSQLMDRNAAVLGASALIWNEIDTLK